MAFTHFVIYSAIFAAVLAETAYFYSCPELASSQLCNVTAVRIDPCTKKKDVCVLKKGFNNTISFDFTPNFVASKLKTSVVWPSSSGELPFVGMTTDDGCVLSTCPTVSGQSQTLDLTLYIGKKLPKGVYEIKWRVWNEENEQQKCCFLSTIQLKK